MPEVTLHVKLARFTPAPEPLIAAAAKLCYARDTAALLDQAEPASARFVRQLRDLGHMSPIEHAVFTFYIEGLSRACSHQLVRHRLASYSQRSQRYVLHDAFDYVLPPQLRGKTVVVQGQSMDAAQYYRQCMAAIAEQYRALNQALGDSGESSNEDARYVLPNACETKLFATMNARQLLHFFEERLCQRAQWEIRQLADRMLDLAREACPAVFENAGPKCVRLQGCPEGKMACGRYAEMAKRYTSPAT